jgi:hypothetical protein
MAVIDKEVLSNSSHSANLLKTWAFHGSTDYCHDDIPSYLCPTTSAFQISNGEQNFEPKLGHSKAVHRKQDR